MSAPRATALTMGVTSRGTTGAPTPFRLAAIDIDDTLAGPDGRVSVANAAAVAELVRHGVRVVLASGRSHANMLPFHKQLGLGTGPVLSAQGALVRDAVTGEVWRTCPVPAAVAAAVTRDGLARGFAVEQYRASGVYLQARTAWTDYDQSRNADAQVLVPDLLGAADPTDPVLKVIWLDDPARVAATAPAASARYAGRLLVTPTDPPYLEFAAPAATKAAALAAVAARLGVPRAATLAFGDGTNDVPMLAWAGLGVAMAHAHPAARAAANAIAPPGDPETALARAVARARGDSSGGPFSGAPRSSRV